MRTRALLGGLLAAMTLGTAPAVAHRGAPDRDLPTSYALPGDAVFPEGVATLGSRFFVGSTTDGTILTGDVRSATTRVLAAPGADGRTTAIGMKADRRGRLVVAGGATGKVFVLSARTGATKAVLDTTPGTAATFLNDVALAGRDTAYVTDSNRPILYRVRLRGDGAGSTIAPFVDFTGTPFAYGPGFNANGIVSAAGGRILLIVQSSTGKVFRVDTRTKAVSEVDLGGATVVNGDGMLLVGGRTLLVVRNRDSLVVPIRLDRAFTRGVAGTPLAPAGLRYPTTIAADPFGRLLVVNSQFDRRGTTTPPDLPFTVSAVALKQRGKHGRG